MDRRRFLAVLTVGTLGGVAGCGGNQTETDTETTPRDTRSPTEGGQPTTTAGGKATATPSPTSTDANGATDESTPTDAQTPTPEESGTPTPTLEATDTPTDETTPTTAGTPAGTETTTDTAGTPTATQTPTRSPTPTATPTPTPTATPTPTPVPYAQTVAVGADGFNFSPENFDISVGDTVQWTWEATGHNVVPDDIPGGSDWTGTPGGEGETYDEGYTHTHTFEVAGTYTYYCAPHQSIGMTGEFTVTE